MGKGISIRSYRNRLALSNFNNLGRVPLRELNPETMARAEINHGMLFVPKTSSLPSEQGRGRSGSAMLPAAGGDPACRRGTYRNGLLAYEPLYTSSRYAHNLIQSGV